ncbi:MAG TPA: type VI secretion system tip protein VgrG [Bacteroidales bacterium]|nr:type VI secretion system tip protein VgrG [Bacteroidales bacterium]
MADSLKNIVKSPVSFTIKSNGKEIPGSYTIISVSVNKEVNKVASALIQLYDGGFADGEGYAVSDSGDFNPGSEIEISAGYASDEETIFKGIVIKHGLRLSHGNFILEIECKDEAIKTTVGRKNRIFEKKTDSDIISEVLGNYSSITIDVESTSYAHPELLQHYIADWDFVIQRAEVNGMVLLNSDGEIKIKKPDAGSPVLKLSPDDGILSFNANIDAKNILGSVKGVSWDMDNQDIIEATSNPPSENKAGNLKSGDLSGIIGLEEYLLNTTANTPMEVLTEWASACHSKSEWSKVRGKISIYGYNKILPGDSINLEDFSDQFNGTIFISSVTHQIEEGDYVTELGLGLSPNWYIEEKPNVFAQPAAGLLPPISGLYIGKVEQIHEDENGQYRVKVSIPTLQSETLSLWARISTLYATAEAGFFFYPEIGDEVIISFLNQDPQNPVILGSVHNKVNVPPIEPTEDNFIKTIVTKEKLKISFDEENKAIIIETPGVNMITMNDTDGIISIKDMNDNIFEMSADGIKVDSAADIIINAKGNIELTSQGDISLSATGDVAIEGVNIENKGQAKFAAEGANCELKGSAQTVIKGGMVMIN